MKMDDRIGKWTCSTSEEHWDHSEDFDTREEAVAYAMTEFAADYGVEDGGLIWVGQIKEIAADDLARHGADAWKVIDNLSERLYELVGDACDYELEVSKDQEADLDERLESAIRGWLNAHGIKPNCFTIEHVEHHVWKQCKETRRVDTYPSAEETPHVERCVLQIEHDGDCEWP